MEQYIPKSTVVAEMEKELNTTKKYSTEYVNGKKYALKKIRSFLDTLEVKDPYEQCVQYDSIKAGIQAHAETYSFNIESELFNQLTKEQQALWRKEIEQACISGGYSGLNLAKDPRYKENLEVKEVDLKKSISDWLFEGLPNDEELIDYIKETAEHFFELGLKAQKGELGTEKYNKNDDTWVIDYRFYPEQGYYITNKKENEYK